MYLVYLDCVTQFTGTVSWCECWILSHGLRLPPSAADIYDQPTSISWLYRTVGGWHLAIRLSLLQARRSEIHYWPSFAVRPSVLATLDAR